MGIGKTGKEQTKLEKLESFRFYELDLETAEHQVAKWSAKLENMAGKKGDIQTFSGGFLPADRVGEYIALWDGIIDFLMERMKLYKERMMECEEICDQLGGKYRTLARLKYIECLPLKEVAERMNYSIPWTKVESAILVYSLAVEEAEAWLKGEDVCAGSYYFADKGLAKAIKSGIPENGSDEKYFKWVIRRNKRVYPNIPEKMI